VGHGCRNHRDARNAQKARKAGHYNGVKMGLKPGATKEEGRDPDPIGVTAGALYKPREAQSYEEGKDTMYRAPT